MKKKLKQRMIKILTVFLAIAVVAGFTPQMGESAYAAGDAAPAISLGTGALNQDVNTEDAQVLHYGGYAWYTIAYDGKDGNGTLTYVNPADETVNLYPEGTVTLLSKSDMGYGTYDYDSEFFGNYTGGSNIYGTSILKEKVDGESGVLNDFSIGEQEAIKDRTLVGGGTESSEESNYDENLIKGDSVEHALLWPLSVAEANMVAFRTVFFYSWWLRSPGLNPGHAALVQSAGDNSKVDRIGEQVCDVFPDYRFAFFLDQDAVLFTSAAAGGKDSGDEGADALLLQTDKSNSGNEWKVTVKDSTHAGFAVDNSGVKYDAGSGVVTVPYRGAVAGDNEFISAIITDKAATDDTATIKYYGRIAGADSASGTVTINTAGKLGSGDYLYVFNEQCNSDATSDGPAQTDYASELKAIDLSEKPVPPTPAKTVNGVPLTTMTASGNAAMTISWLKTEGADGYDIFFAKCDGKGKTTTKNIKSIEGNSIFTWTASGLKAGVSYKAYVRAYVMKDGQKQYAVSSPLMHAYTKGYTKRYTNAKSVKVNKKKVSVKAGKSVKLKVKVRKLKKNKKLMQKKHELKVRYLSTNTSVATVSKKGKIKGVKAGTCCVYAYAHNGVFKMITVTVK